MEAVLLVEIEMSSLRLALKQQIPEADWAQARFDQLNLLDERKLRAADHVRAYQRKMAHTFKKRVKPKPLHIGDLVLRVIRGLIRDPKGTFREERFCYGRSVSASCREEGDAFWRGVGRGEREVFGEGFLVGDI